MRVRTTLAFAIALTVTLAGAFVGALHLGGAALPRLGDAFACASALPSAPSCGPLEHVLLAAPLVMAGALALLATTLPSTGVRRAAIIALALAPLPWMLFHLASRGITASGAVIGAIQVGLLAAVAAVAYAYASKANEPAASA